MKRWERIAAAFFMLLGIAAALLAFQMGYGSTRFPGPGYLPFWLAAILAGVSAIYFASQLGPDARRGPLWQSGTWVRPTLAAVVMLTFAFLMAWLGFFASTFLMFLAWLSFIERESWFRIGAVSVLGTAGAYILFALLLKVPLPKGLLF
jgi:hypothetical protein